MDVQCGDSVWVVATTKFMAWLYSDVTHEALMDHKMAPLSDEGRAAALEVLKAITCDGEFILPHCKFCFSVLCPSLIPPFA